MINLIGSKWNVHSISRITARNLFRSHSLYRRISVAGNPATSMSSILDQWVQEGRIVEVNELRRFVKLLRSYRRHNHALGISEWMNNERKMDLSSGDIAVRLDLISKVHGLDQAEKYFSSIPESLRDFRVYSALLHCYVRNKSLEKAEGIMQYIGECEPMDGTDFTLSYNVLLKLYAQLGKYEKLDALMQEMKEKDMCDKLTLTTRLRAYVMANDIDGMEKFLAKIEADPRADVDWRAYSTAADGYTNARQLDKSLVMLKKAEQLVDNKQRIDAYESLMTKFAAIGNKNDVYHIWNMCKNLPFLRNSTYVCFLTALAMLEDVYGAERFIEEWESKNKSVNKSFSNLMVSVYCNNSLLEKAEAYVGRLLGRGIEVDGRTWERLVRGYLKSNDMDKAVQTMKKAILADRQGQKPHLFTFAPCIEHLKDHGDLELALEILRICRERGCIAATTANRLSGYVHGEIQETNAFDLLKGDYNLIKL